jgi:hypothetical protein
MSQDRESGAIAVEYGLQTARRIAQILGARKRGSPRSNEYQLENRTIVIKCARAKTNVVGVSYQMLNRVTAILGSFEVEKNVYEIYGMAPNVYRRLMTPTRSSGASAGRVGMVTKSAFKGEGSFLRRVNICV